MNALSAAAVKHLKICKKFCKKKKQTELASYKNLSFYRK